MFHRFLLIAGCLALAPLSTSAAPLTPGHLIVVSGQTLYELSPIGLQVQSLNLPGSTEPARDVVLDAASRVQIFHGLSQPLLSTWDADEDAWMHSALAGWSTTDEETSPGGLAPLGRDLVAIDRATESAGSARGLVRFEGEEGYRASRFAMDHDYIDVTLGHDFQLYALRADQISVDLYDTTSLERTQTVQLSEAVRALAVDRRGNIFGAAWEGNIHRFNRQGILQQTFESGATRLLDLDLSQDGRLAAGARDGNLILTTTALTSARLLTVTGADAVFVAFVETPRESGVLGTPFEEGHVGDWSLWIDP